MAVPSKKDDILFIWLFFVFRSLIGRVRFEILSVDNTSYIVRFDFWDFGYFFYRLVGFRTVFVIRVGFRPIIGQIDELDNPIWKRYFHNELNLG